MLTSRPALTCHFCRDIQAADAPVPQPGEQRREERLPACHAVPPPTLLAWYSKPPLDQAALTQPSRLHPTLQHQPSPLDHALLQVAVVTAALARWYLLLIQWVVTFLRWTGQLRLADDDTSPAASSTGADGSAAPEPAHRTARQMVRDTVRGGLRATARAAQMVMHHRGLPEETLAAIERACEEATKVCSGVGCMGMFVSVGDDHIVPHH